MNFSRQTLLPLIAAAALAGFSPSVDAKDTLPKASPGTPTNAPPQVNGGGGVIVDPVPPGGGGGKGCVGVRCIDTGKIANMGTFQMDSGGAPGATTPPPADTPAGAGPAGGGSSGGGGPAGGPGAMPGNVSAIGAARHDILPGQMDALRGDVASANGAQQVSAGPVDGVSVLTRTSPQMLGGAGGGGGHSRASDMMHAAQSKMRLKDYAGAAAVAKQMIAENPKDDKGYTLLSMAANHSKDYATAEQAAKSAIKLNPKNAVALQNQAWAQVHEKKLVEAIDAADQAIKLKPDSAGNYAVKAFAEGMLGKKDAALADLETAAAIDPRFMGRLEAAKKTGVIFDPDDDDAGLNDDMAGKAAAGGEGGAASPIKVGGLVLLVLGLWGGIQLGRRMSGTAAAASAPIIPLKFPPKA